MDKTGMAPEDTEDDPCEGCVDGAQVKVNNIIKHDDGSVTFTENLTVQDDELLSEEVKDGALIEHRKNTVTESTITTTLDAEGNVVNSDATIKITESEYTYTAEFIKVNGKQRLLETYGTPENSKTVTTHKMSGNDFVGIFGGVAQKSLKSGDGFPLVNDFVYVNMADSPANYIGDGVGGEEMMSVMVGRAPLRGDYGWAEHVNLSTDDKIWNNPKYQAQLNQQLRATYKK